MTYPPTGGQPVPPPYGGPGYPNAVPPKKSTPPWVLILTGGIVVAAIVAVVLIFALRSSNDPVGGPSGSTSAAPVSTSEPSVGQPSDPTGVAPSEAQVNEGIVGILTDAAKGKFTDSQIQQIADCATPKLMDELSPETLQNYADGKDVASSKEDGDTAADTIQQCRIDVTGS